MMRSKDDNGNSLVLCWTFLRYKLHVENSAFLFIPELILRTKYKKAHLHWLILRLYNK